LNTPTPSESDESTVSRRGIEVVIRRAIELSLKEQDSREEVSEAELIKIAEELGLSPRHVRQALYERPPEEELEPGFLDRYFGSTSVVAARAVACDAPTALGRLEDYLVTREYLQIHRRQGPSAVFEPADDAFSSLARAFTSGRSHLSRAQRANLTVRPLEPGWCHVRLELSYPDKRRSNVIGAGITSTMFGGITGGLVAVGMLFTIGGSALATPVAFAGGLASAVGTFTAIWVAFRNGYKRWLARSHDEADAVLDRLQHGDDLRPPASPWLRRLQQRLRGFGVRPAG
jgi:hypothetical protein